MVRTGTLSGGNLQKALLARELSADPMVVIAAQPTRGLDVSAAGFVHSRFLELRSQGRALLVIPSVAHRTGRVERQPAA